MLKVLVAEDDEFIADMVTKTLVRHGYELCGVARTVSEALSFGRRYRPDLAIIDLQLADEGGLGTDIVASLNSSGPVGVLYASGGITRAMLNVLQGHACLIKPYNSADLLRSLEIVAEIVATGIASPPYPRGLRLLAGASNAGPSFA